MISDKNTKMIEQITKTNRKNIYFGSSCRNSFRFERIIVQNKDRHDQSAMSMQSPHQRSCVDTNSAHTKFYLEHDLFYFSHESICKLANMPN